jgi:hypothetical protein
MVTTQLKLQIDHRSPNLGFFMHLRSLSMGAAFLHPLQEKKSG